MCEMWVCFGVANEKGTWGGNLHPWEGPPVKTRPLKRDVSWTGLGHTWQRAGESAREDKSFVPAGMEGRGNVCLSSGRVADGVDYE